MREDMIIPICLILINGIKLISFIDTDKVNATVLFIAVKKNACMSCMWNYYVDPIRYSLNK